jgi:hypothetical protein
MIPPLSSPLVFLFSTGRRINREGGKAKLKSLTADVGLIRVVVRREAPSNHADGYPHDGVVKHTNSLFQFK